MGSFLSEQARLRLALAAPTDGPRPRVLLLVSQEPPRAAGPWAADLLALIGGEPFRAAPEAEGKRPEEDGDFLVSWEEVLEFDPQLVLLESEPGAEARRVKAWMAVEGWNRVEAARLGRVLPVPEGFLRAAGAAEAQLAELQAFLKVSFWPGRGKRIVED